MEQAIQHHQRGGGLRIQAPLVDSVSCYCKVDTGLKTVAGATKFVPGSKLCIQPDIRPSVHKSKNSRSERTRVQPPLLPGLPDDLAIACLIRVPRIEHLKLRLVCKRWYRLLSGNYLYSLRKSLGIAEEWVYVIKRDRDGRISWHAFDPTYQLWQPLPPVPGEFAEALGFGCAVLSGCHLYLFGGKDPLRGSMRRVIFFNARTNKWHRAPDMLRKRHFFGSCVINNCLYVAGGECEGMQRTLRSAEVYDPNRNKWSFISDMSTAMIVCIAVVGHQNNPLYIQSFTDADDALKLHHIVHCSLDVVDERVNNPKKSGPMLNETFLGLLYPTENYKVYGYLTNTKVKFILVTTDLDVRDTDVRNFFRNFHTAYVDAVSNPFHVPGKKITSRTFAERVSTIVKSFGLSSTV